MFTTVVLGWGSRVERVSSHHTAQGGPGEAPSAPQDGEGLEASLSSPVGAPGPVMNRPTGVTVCMQVWGSEGVCEVESVCADVVVCAGECVKVWGCAGVCEAEGVCVQVWGYV